MHVALLLLFCFVLLIPVGFNRHRFLFVFNINNINNRAWAIVRSVGDV